MSTTGGVSSSLNNSSLVSTSTEENSSKDTAAREVEKILRDDIEGADFLVSLFWGAMSSFRHDSILRPFPPEYMESTRLERTEGSREVEGEKDIDRLRQVFNSLPTLHEIASGKTTLSTQQVKLLHWILSSKKFKISSTGLGQLDAILEQLSSEGSGSHSPSSQYPKYMFEVKYSDELEARFQSLAKDHGTTYAFHGSSVENFHSIVHNGLLNIFNKVSAFGEGNYLSTELSVCLNWSPGGPLWPHSSLAQSASCVALCEVIKHPSVLSRTQIGGEPSLQQKVPEKYFVVKNDEFVRVKYVLVYETQKQVKPSKKEWSILKWLGPNKFVLVIVLYICFLLYIGASQSKYVKKVLRRYFFYR